MKKFLTNAKLLLLTVLIILTGVMEICANITVTAFFIGIALWILQLIAFPLIAIQIFIVLLLSYISCVALIRLLGR